MLLKIAEIVFSMMSDVPAQPILPGDPFEAFRGFDDPEVSLRFHFKSKRTFDFREIQPLITRGSLSGLYYSDGEVALISGRPAAPQMVVFFRDNFCDVEAFFAPPWQDVFHDGLLAFLPGYPPLRMAFNYLMARRGGLLVHGCGVIHNDKGYLFAGHSDQGKSTMARLWGKKALLLGDEIMALLSQHGRFRIYGTPWHGDYAKVSYGGPPLKKIFFLRHSEKNFAKPVAGATAGSMLLARSFTPIWDREGMAFTLNTVDRLVNEVPCYELGFFPDDRVVDFVRGL